MSHDKFDLIVIGTGTAGFTPALRCRREGWKVAVVDKQPYGGTCPLRGCDPKKVLVGATEVVDCMRRFHGRGVTGEAAIDWQELMVFKRTFTDPVPESRKKSLSEAGVEQYRGVARFSDPHTIEVDGKYLESRHFLIASGAHPRTLGILGVDLMTHSDQFLELETLPRHIVFMGGGYVSMEFAHIARRAGAEVTVIHSGERILNPFDPFLAGELMKASQEIGIGFILNTTVTEVTKKGDKLLVIGENEGKSVEVDGDMVVHGAGRVPDIFELELEKAGIEHNDRGVVVNKYLQSVSHEHIYAAGDAAQPGRPLTPVAGAQAQIVAVNLLNGNSSETDYTATPTCVFTLPVLASVGLREDQAKDQGLKFTVNQAETSSWYTHKRINESHSGYTVLIEEETERILGAHLLGTHAGEVINLFALAIRHNISAAELRRGIFSYPTSSYDIRYML